VGVDKPDQVNVRLVVATHRNLEGPRETKFIPAGPFHRIYVFPLVSSRLAEGRKISRPLVGNFRGPRCRRNNDGNKKTFSEEAIADLHKYSWREMFGAAQCGGAAVFLAESSAGPGICSADAAVGGRRFWRVGTVCFGFKWNGHFCGADRKLEKSPPRGDSVGGKQFHMTQCGSRARRSIAPSLYKKCQLLGMTCKSLRKAQ